MSRRTRPRRTRVRGALLCLALVAPVAPAAACGEDSAETPAPGTTLPSASQSTIVGTGGTAPASDQRSPVGTNGIRYANGRLWIADLAGGELVVADASDGTILARFGPDDGVTGGPDDLVLAEDGTVYWTGFNDGTVGHLTLDGRGRTIATLAPGANPIAWGPTGTLFVGIAVTGDGLYEIDPNAEPAAVRLVAEAVGNVNAFAFGPDGWIYGPSFAEAEGSIVRIDPATGEVETVAEEVGYPVAARFAPDGVTLLVASNLPGRLLVVDTETGEVRPRLDLPGTVDNFAVAPDGTLYVTTFNTPQVIVVAPDDTISTITIGS